MAISLRRYGSQACDKMQGQITSGTCSIAQMAGVAAATGDMQPTYDMVTEFRKRRDLVHGLLNDIPGIKTNLPEGAFYFFFDVSSFFGKSFNGFTVKNPEDMSAYLLKEALIALVNGEAFGDQKCLRLSYAASQEKLITVCQRLKDALAKLN